MKLSEAIEKGHEVYFKNAYWKDVYENAPEDAKKYYDLMFSQYTGKDNPEYLKEFEIEKNKVYEGISGKGWNYLIAHANSNMLKEHLLNKRVKYTTMK